jgi:hypothetical protein
MAVIAWSSGTTAVVKSATLMWPAASSSMASSNSSM